MYENHIKTYTHIRFTLPTHNILCGKSICGKNSSSRDRKPAANPTTTTTTANKYKQFLFDQINSTGEKENVPKENL